MQRRDFLKIGAAGAVTVAVQGVTLAEPHMHGDNIWKETPETVEGLVRCIHKYTNPLFDSMKAWEQLHVQDSSGKWHIQNAVHISYSVMTPDQVSASGTTPEQRLVRTMWNTARQLITSSSDETPHLIWRRRPIIDRPNDHELFGAMKQISMRMWISGDPQLPADKELPLKNEGEPMKVIA